LSHPPVQGPSAGGSRPPDKTPGRPATRAPAGVRATRCSPGLISLGTPTITGA
jgi:hypothetical protein